MDNNLDKILQRILNLRARAEDSASSEAEIFASVDKANQLMEAYKIEEADLAIAENEGRIQVEIVSKKATDNGKKKKSRHPIVFVVGSIAKYSNTKILSHVWNSSFEIIGHRTDVELADYLISLIKNGLDSSYDAYWKSAAGNIGRGAKSSFQIAMARNIYWRLHRMAEDEENNNCFAKSKEKNESYIDKRALIIANLYDEKQRMANDYVNNKYGRLSASKHISSRTSNTNAAQAGTIAGQNFSLSKGVAGKSVIKSIGK